MESQTEGDLSDLADLSVHAAGTADVKKEPGKSGSTANALNTLVAKQHKILESVKEVNELLFLRWKIIVIYRNKLQTVFNDN